MIPSPYLQWVRKNHLRGPRSAPYLLVRPTRIELLFDICSARKCHVKSGAMIQPHRFCISHLMPDHN